MKIIKPLSQSLLCKVFEADNKFYFCTSILSGFQFDTGTLLAEPDLWKFIPSELGKDAIVDQCMPKPNGEVLVTGKCFASNGNANAGEVALTMKSIDKKLFVFGNRYWKKNMLQQATISEPELFSEMNISWDNAFGGPEYKDNPLGIGYKSLKTADNQEIHQLPNIEYPQKLIGSVNDKPTPAGFGPIDMMLPQRFKKAGTYDEKWQKELFPGLARDIDHTFFNTAPEDQWIKGFFNGDESFSIRGMHPQNKNMNAKLPSFKSRCFINRKTDAGEEFIETETVLDTVWLFPHAQKGIFIWRGVTEISTDDAEDILHVMIAYERLTDEPKSFTHYKDTLIKRMDEETGYLQAISEKDLIPYGEKSALAMLMKHDKPEDALTKNMNAKVIKEKEKAEKKRDEALQKVKKMAEKAGIDPATIMPNQIAPAAPIEIPGLDPENFDPEIMIAFIKKTEAEADQIAEKAMADALVKKELAEKKIREVCEKQGLKFEEVISKLKSQKIKRPLFSAEATVQKLQGIKENIDSKIDLFCKKTGSSFEAILAEMKASPDKKFPLIEAAEKTKKINPTDPVLISKLIEAEQTSIEMYKQTAHFQLKPEPLSEKAAIELREIFLAKLKEGESFSGQDFAGADLHGLDLIGCNLKDIYLEGADLSGADLSETDLSGAALSWANLTGAIINRATLIQTNFGGTDCTRAVINECDLTGAIFGKAVLTQTSFHRSNLTEADFFEAKFEKTDFSNAIFTEALLIERDFSGSNFSGADCSKSIFIKPKLENANFCQATLSGAVFIEASAQKATFNGADSTKALFISKSNLKNADFSNVTLDNANLMEADLTGADFSNAQLSNANLINAKCNKADFSGADAKSSLCMKTDFEGADLTGINFMEASLKGARLVGTDLSHSNMFGAELFRVVLGNTKFDNANLKKTKLALWRPDDKR